MLSNRLLHNCSCSTAGSELRVRVVQAGGEEGPVRRTLIRVRLEEGRPLQEIPHRHTHARQLLSRFEGSVTRHARQQYPKEAGVSERAWWCSSQSSDEANEHGRRMNRYEEAEEGYPSSGGGERAALNEARTSEAGGGGEGKDEGRRAEETYSEEKVEQKSAR